jgi:hypothetical protein
VGGKKIRGGGSPTEDRVPWHVGTEAEYGISGTTGTTDIAPQGISGIHGSRKTHIPGAGIARTLYGGDGDGDGADVVVEVRW